MENVFCFCVSQRYRRSRNAVRARCPHPRRRRHNRKLPQCRRWRRVRRRRARKRRHCRRRRGMKRCHPMRLSLRESVRLRVPWKWSRKAGRERSRRWVDRPVLRLPRRKIGNEVNHSYLKCSFDWLIDWLIELWLPNVRIKNCWTGLSVLRQFIPESLQLLILHWNAVFVVSKESEIFQITKSWIFTKKISGLLLLSCTFLFEISAHLFRVTWLCGGNFSHSFFCGLFFETHSNFRWPVSVRVSKFDNFLNKKSPSCLSSSPERSYEEFCLLCDHYDAYDKSRPNESSVEEQALIRQVQLSYLTATPDPGSDATGSPTTPGDREKSCLDALHKMVYDVVSRKSLMKIFCLNDWLLFMIVWGEISQAYIEYARRCKALDTTVLRVTLPDGLKRMMAVNYINTVRAGKVSWFFVVAVVSFWLLILWFMDQSGDRAIDWLIMLLFM